MVVAAGFLAFGIACAIGAWFVFREAAQQVVEPRPPVYSMDEAYEWVVAHLDELVAQTLTPDDVRGILQLQIEFFAMQGLTNDGETPRVRADVVLGTSETVDYIISRSAAAGEEYLPEQVYPVVETQLAYLRAIGAVGPQR
jgi:hypothetical protein